MISEYYTFDTIVVGSGAAGLSAMERLDHYGVDNTALVTESLLSGTSRNTGSDKQTYYKLSLSGGEDDSVRKMAETLFSGGCMDGDIALAEAANSVRCFCRLCELGVQFPFSEYGEYVGYKTDHDPCSRGTSTGPLTSRDMTIVLLREVQRRNLRIFDGFLVVKVLTEEDAYRGLLCMTVNDAEPRLVLFFSKQVIFATGGPAGMYARSVFPKSQHGSSGVLLDAGVAGKNLTEWQFGIASLAPRWNVSGSYMQVLPRIISTASDGKSDPQEFLLPFYESKALLLNNIFRKGYQWPFDVRKIQGSSLIDILIYREVEVLGRRVFLDFTQNCKNEPIPFEQLDPEVYTYLENGGILSGTPIERLLKLNTPAYDLFHGKGVDLAVTPLEIAVCAQHNNGGMDVDCWWQTNIAGLYCCGEVAGTHGVYRPGGSALNSGQVGAERSAYHIARTRDPGPLDAEALLERFSKTTDQFIRMIDNIRVPDSGQETLGRYEKYFTSLMSQCGGPIRDRQSMQDALEEINAMLGDFPNTIRATTKNLPRACILYNTLISQQAYLVSFIDYSIRIGESRGSALYHNSEGSIPDSHLNEAYRCIIDQGEHLERVQMQRRGKCRWRNVRPVPQADLFFENIWREFRKNSL